MSPWVLILFFAAQSNGTSFMSVDMTSKTSCDLARMQIEQKKYDRSLDDRENVVPLAVCVER